MGYYPSGTLFKGNVPQCWSCSSFRSMNHPTPLCPLITTEVDILGMGISPDNSVILVALRYPILAGVRIISLWPAVISPRPKMMMGVMLMMVMIMMDVKMSKHMVEMDRQLRRALLFRLTVHSFFILYLIL